jgi:hypothetical protein
MCDFKNLTDEEKEHFHQLLTNCANNFGGQNFFLQLLEEIRERNTHPLCSKHQDFLSNFGTVKWGKTIFNDKIQLIIETRNSKDKKENFLPEQDNKSYKRILNLIKTLSPITFSVRPNLRENGEGFDFPAFDRDKNITKLNPIFDTLFFCNIETVKKILNYKK